MNKNTGGYTLLEILVVLAIIGVMMMTAALYARKQIEDASRQATGNALVSEIAGVLRFVNDDEFNTEGQVNPAKNPLYDITNADYARRTGNTDSGDDVSATGFFRWDVTNSDRGYFRDERCNADGGKASIYKFTGEYITCRIDPLLENKELRLERVDFVGDTATRRINRVDFFVAYYPAASSDSLSAELYVKNIEKAFGDMKIPYSAAFYIERSKTETDKTRWNLMKANTTVPVERIKFGDMASHLGRFSNSASTDYGIRFSFIVGDGQYLKSDGSVGADKLCWNASTKMSGPCLTGNPDNDNELILSSGGTGTDNEPAMCWDARSGTSRLCLSPTQNGSALELTGRDTTDPTATRKTATLMANVVVKDDKGELTTIPKVTYQSFKGDGAEIVQGENYSGNIGSAIERNGLIFIPEQTCPVNPESAVKENLHPRLSAAISSVIPETMDNNSLEANLTVEAKNRSTAVKNVGKFGGVALQIDLVGEKDVPGTGKGWIITATTGNYDGNDGKAKVYISPKSLSIVTFMWCSSIEQPKN